MIESGSSEALYNYEIESAVSYQHVWATCPGYFESPLSFIYQANGTKNRESLKVNDIETLHC